MTVKLFSRAIALSFCALGQLSLSCGKGSIPGTPHDGGTGDAGLDWRGSDGGDGGSSSGIIPNITGDFDGGMAVYGVERYFLLHVPANIATANIPIIFGLHDAGDNPFNFCYGTGLINFSDINGVIVVCPAAIDGLWDTDESIRSSEADINFVLQLLRAIQAVFPIDPKRIYACGFSRGAGFTGILATTSGQSASFLQGYQYQSPFAAFGISAGNDFYGGQLNFNLTVPKRPIWIMHGTADNTIPFSDGRSFAFALQDAGWPVTFTAIRGAPHTWLWQEGYGYTDNDLWHFFVANPLP